MRNRFALLVLIVLLFGLISFFKKNDSQPAEIAKEIAPVEPAKPVVKANRGPILDQQSKPPESKISQEKVAELRSHARAHLSASYAAQKAYFAEYNRYSTDLRSVGWVPGRPVMHYKMGFLRPFNPSKYIDFTDVREEPRRMDTDIFLSKTDHITNEIYSYDEAAGAIRLGDYEQYCRSSCTADEKQFEIMIAVPLGDKNHVDVWTINDKKELTLVVDGQKGLF